MKTNLIRQRTSATALVELLTDHPELPALSWDVSPQGTLRGALFGIESDLGEMAAVFAAALGGTPYGSRYTSQMDGRPHEVVHLDVVWRDVAVYVTLGGAQVPMAVSA